MLIKAISTFDHHQKGLNMHVNWWGRTPIFLCHGNACMMVTCPSHVCHMFITWSCFHVCVTDCVCSIVVSPKTRWNRLSFMWHYVIMLQLPIKFSATGLTEGPGGSEYNDRYLACVWRPCSPRLLPSSPLHTTHTHTHTGKCFPTIYTASYWTRMDRYAR